MHYEQLTIEEQDDFLAIQLYGREREHFDYDFNRRQFEALMDVLEPGPERENITLRLAETKEALAQVSRYITAMRSRIRSPEAHAAACIRTKLQREKAQ